MQIITNCRGASRVFVNTYLPKTEVCKICDIPGGPHYHSENKDSEKLNGSFVLELGKPGMRTRTLNILIYELP